MLGLNKKTVLSSVNFTDAELFMKTADRLQNIYKKRFGREYNYGQINFIFFDGQFMAIREETGKILFTIEFSDLTTA